jgi:hypothetical protein
VELWIIRTAHYLIFCKLCVPFCAFMFLDVCHQLLIVKM